MKKLLFITLSHLSSGEFTIAVEFAKRLDPSKFKTLFLTSEKGEKLITDSGLDCHVLKKHFPPDPQLNRKIVLELIAGFEPDYFIHSDAYTTEYSHSWSGVLVDFFKQFNKPVVNFDEYEYPNTDYVIDYYGDYRTRVFSHLNKFDYLIRMCPINKWSPPEKNVFCTSLYSRVNPKSEQEKRDFRKKVFGLENKKYIFTATSTWEMLNVTRLPALTQLMQWMPSILLNYLDELGEEITLVHVGPQKWKNKQQNVEYIHFDYMHPEMFEEYILNANLFITTNMVSVTLSKAVYGQVPSILVTNDKVLYFDRFKEQLREMPAWYSEMAEDVKVAYPYEVFPFGWKSLLKVVLNNNTYTDCLVRAPLFQRTKLINLFKKYLNDETAITMLKKSQAGYVESVLGLTSPDQIVEAWAK